MSFLSAFNSSLTVCTSAARSEHPAPGAVKLQEERRVPSTFERVQVVSSDRSDNIEATCAS